jgi:hypothetical protein
MTFKDVNPYFPEQSVRDSLEEYSLEGINNFPQDQSAIHFISSSPGTMHKFQQSPKDEVHVVTHENICYTPKELHNLSSLVDINVRNMCESGN